MALSPDAIAAGYRLDHRPVTGSTMDDATAAWRAGEPGRLWIVAERQTGGRGRLGRPWTSPEGNLHASLLLASPCALREAPQLGFLAGLALIEAVERILPPSAAGRLSLKWPNDLLCDGAKCAGLLLEGASRADGARAVVFGFGVDVAFAPDDAPYPVARLTDLTPRVDAPSLLAALSGAMARRVAAFEAADPQTRFARLREAWIARAAQPDGPLRVRHPSGDKVGRFAGLDEFGRLLLATPTGVEAIEAGDLHFPAHGANDGVRTKPSSTRDDADR